MSTPQLPQVETCYRTPNGDCYIGGCPEGTHLSPETNFCEPLPPRSEAIQEVEFHGGNSDQSPNPSANEPNPTPAQPVPVNTLPVTGGGSSAYMAGDLLSPLIFLGLIAVLACTLIKDLKL
jgi:hypothetical protein